MIKIMFVCHGNICRSPMAEFVFKDMLQKQGRAGEFFVASCATSSEEIFCGVGNPVYPPAKAKLAEHGISCGGKRAVKLRAADYENYDLFVAMDDNNVRNIMRIFGADSAHKVKKLLDYCGGGNVADPWYSRDFDAAYNDICRGCAALLKSFER